MKINVIKNHPTYSKGEQEVSLHRGRYLVRVGIAEEVTEDTEKVEKKTARKEKAEGVKPGKK